MTMISMSITSFALLSLFSTLPFQTTSFQQQHQQPSFIVRGKESSSSTSSLFEAMSSSSETEPKTTLNHIKGVEDISNKYSTFLLDMWGVMHNGSTTYDGVLQTIQNLVQTNKKLIILSNSSKRLSNSNKMLTKLGFTPDSDFCTIITSGDVSHRMLSGDGSLKCTTWDTLQKLLDADSENSDDNNGNNKNVFVFGSGDNDEEYMTTCGWKLSSLKDANLIVARGTFTINDGSGNIIHKNNDEGLYFEILEQMLEQASKGNVHSNFKPIPMLVTNPDKVRPDKGLPPMPGAIGDAYEKYIHKLTGDNDNNDDDVDVNFDIQQIVKRIGKPYSEVYELALNECNDPSSVIMVGDALETDITGGKWSNIDTLWVVNDGIHSPYIQENGGDDKFEENVEVVLDDFNQKKGYTTEEEKLCPTYVAKHFRW